MLFWHHYLQYSNSQHPGCIFKDCWYSTFCCDCYNLKSYVSPRNLRQSSHNQSTDKKTASWARNCFCFSCVALCCLGSVKIKIELFCFVFTCTNPQSSRLLSLNSHKDAIDCFHSDFMYSKAVSLSSNCIAHLQLVFLKKPYGTNHNMFDGIKAWDCGHKYI